MEKKTASSSFNREDEEKGAGKLRGIIVVYFSSSSSGFSSRQSDTFTSLFVETLCTEVRVTQSNPRFADFSALTRLFFQCPDFVKETLSYLRNSVKVTMEDIENIEEDECGFSRNYFLAKELSGSSKRSAHKLSDINIVDEQVLRETAFNIETKHAKETSELLNDYKTMYLKWVFELRCGFGLLMYGFGSKKGLIEDFASASLTEYSVVVINGYLPSVNLKQVLLAIADLLSELLKCRRKSSGSLSKGQETFPSRSIDDILSFLHGSQSEDKDCFICVVVHNIDGPALRDPESQQTLAQLASCSHIRIIASIDHVNAPLLWDKKMVHKQFNWLWHHVPTFAPYKVEGVFFPLVLAQGSTAQTSKTAAIVLQSLTPNAQNVFKILAEYQLSHPDEDGMPTDDLYSASRERFFVSSQVTLNSHLTEFKDHELVKTKRNSDGQECLNIPLSSDALRQLLLDLNQ